LILNKVFVILVRNILNQYKNNLKKRKNMQPFINQNQHFVRDLTESVKKFADLVVTPIKNPLIDVPVRLASTLYAANKFAGWAVRDKIASCAGFAFDKMQLIKDLKPFTSKLAAEKWDVISEKLCLTACKTAKDLGSDTLEKIAVNCSSTSGSIFKDRCFRACVEPSSYYQGITVGAINLISDVLIDRVLPEQQDSTRWQRVKKFAIKSVTSAAATAVVLTSVYRMSLGDITAVWVLNKSIHTAAQVIYNRQR
jgi:hypothetical protein